METGQDWLGGQGDLLIRLARQSGNKERIFGLS